MKQTLFKSRVFKLDPSFKKTSFFLTKGQLGCFSLKEIDSFVDYLDESISYIKRLKDPRYIIIETWLIIDFCVRRSIILGVSIHPYVTDYLGNKILPKSFNEIINLFEEILKSQKSLPSFPKRTPTIDIDGEILSVMSKNNKKLLDEIYTFYYNFLKEYYPENLKHPNFNIFGQCYDPLEYDKYQFVTKSWLSAFEKIDPTWFSQVKKLNVIRNICAHSFKKELIYEKLGISKEKSKRVKVKKFCFKLIEQLLSIKIK